MYQSATETLATIGKQLHAGGMPRILNNGILVPSDDIVLSQKLGKRTKVNEPSEYTFRPKTQPWERRGTSPARSRPSNQATQIVEQQLSDIYLAQIEEIKQAYPSSRFWPMEDGLWIKVHSQLLDNPLFGATFIIHLPFTPFHRVRGWGFWNNDSWIGPRHTNFPDGSICAFDQLDETWLPGGKIVHLIDLYSLWACKHLHLQFYGFWPGYQSITNPHERLTEINDNEYCGCNNYDTLYRECCYADDQKFSLLSISISLIVKNQMSNRLPPREVVEFLHRESDPHC